MGITKPSKAIFWISLILGVAAIINEFVKKFLTFNVLGITESVLIFVAFVLLVLGVIFKKL
jgi:hypothetical protein